MDFCMSGEEAVKQVKKAYKNNMAYKIIFTDFSMPGMDGIQATSEIRKFLKEEQNLSLENQPTIIGITGHVHTDFTQKGIMAGMDEVLSKPCYLDIIVKTLVKYELLN